MIIFYRIWRQISKLQSTLKCSHCFSYNSTLLSALAALDNINFWQISFISVWQLHMNVREMVLKCLFDGFWENVVNTCHFSLWAEPTVLLFKCRNNGRKKSKKDRKPPQNSYFRVLHMEFSLTFLDSFQLPIKVSTCNMEQNRSNFFLIWSLFYFHV